MLRNQLVLVHIRTKTVAVQKLSIRLQWRIQGRRQGKKQISQPNFIHYHEVSATSLLNNRLAPPGLVPCLWKFLDPPLD